MTWFISGDVSVANGSKVVAVNDGYDVSNIVRGDAIIINDHPPQEINTTRTGEIELLRPWPHASETNVGARVMPTSADFQDAAQKLRHATSLTIENTKAINEWTTALGTVTFVDPETLEEYEVKTPRQLELEGQIQVDDASGSATAAANSAAAAAASEATSAGHAAAAGTSETNAANSAASALSNKNLTQTYRDQAESAKSNAELARTAAETAEAGAVAAKVGLETARDAAIAAQNAAEASEIEATNKAAEAAGSATAAAASESAAATSEAAAASSKTAAANSATAASGSASTATTKATEAANSATAANAHKDAALAAEAKAQDWAEELEDVPVETGKFSAKHHAAKAADSATVASTHSTSAQAARDAAQAAQASAEAAQSVAEAAASAADNSKTNAAASASAAATSETNASGSASAASGSASAASTSATNANTAKTAAEAAKVAAELARDEAQLAASALEGAMVEMGGWDASSGALPTIPTNANGEQSAFWKITVAGTLNSVDYGVGDSLVYSANLTEWYKIDNTESVTSVNGQQGVVVLSPGDLGAAEANHNHDAAYRPIGWVPSWDDVTGKPASYNPHTYTRGSKTYWHPSTGIYFESGDHSINHNDGGGNFNIRIGHYWDAATGYARYSDNNSGIHLNFAHENADPYYDILFTGKTSATGAAANEQVTSWLSVMKLYRDRINTTRIQPNAHGVHDLGKEGTSWRNIYGVTLFENGVSLGSRYSGINHNHDTDYLLLNGGGTVEGNVRINGEFRVKDSLLFFDSRSIAPTNSMNKVYNGIDVVNGSENLAFLARGDDATDRMAWMTDFGSANTWLERMTLILQTGYVGINQTAPSCELEVGGTTKTTDLVSKSSTTLGVANATQGNSMLAQWNTTGEFGRFYFAPRTLDDSAWDWTKEFGFDWNTGAWYCDTNFQIKNAAPTDPSHAVRKDYVDNLFLPMDGSLPLTGPLDLATAANTVAGSKHLRFPSARAWNFQTRGVDANAQLYLACESTNKYFYVENANGVAALRVYVNDSNGFVDALGELRENNQRVFSPNNPPNAAQVNALALSGGVLTGNVSSSGYFSVANQGSSTLTELLRLGNGGHITRAGLGTSRIRMGGDDVIRMYAGANTGNTFLILGDKDANTRMTFGVNNGESILRLMTANYGTGAYIKAINAGVNGANLILSSGGNTVIGAGESTGANAVAAGNTSENLHLGADSTMYFYSNANTWSSRKTMSFSTAGVLTVPGDITWSSDVKLKKKFKAITGALAKAAEVGGWTYIRKANGQLEAGIKAQELQAVLPEAVLENEDGYLTVTSGGQHALAFAALGEAKQRIESLESEVAELKQLVKALLEK